MDTKKNTKALYQRMLPKNDNLASSTRATINPLDMAILMKELKALTIINKDPNNALRLSLKPIRKSYLSKSGGSVTTQNSYKRRWFLLDTFGLRYFELDDERILKGDILFRTIQSVTLNNDNCCLYITIVSGRVYNIQSTSIEMIEWATDLVKALEYFDKILSSILAQSFLCHALEFWFMKSLPLSQVAQILGNGVLIDPPTLTPPLLLALGILIEQQADLYPGLTSKMVQERFVQAGGFNEEAITELKKCHQDNAIAGFLIGKMYFLKQATLFKQIEERYSVAVLWFKKAADQRCAQAQNSYGLCLQFGFGVEKNVAEAIIWYKKAAENGLADANIHLGDLYEHGNGVKMDLYEAFGWYRKAAYAGSANGQYYYARCYQFGIGTNINFIECKRLMDSAAKQGHELAQAYLAT